MPHRLLRLTLHPAGLGWEAALSALHGPQRPTPGLRRQLGQFLEELKTKADLKPETLRGYAIAFRAIIEDIFGMTGGKEKYGRRKSLSGSRLGYESTA